MSQALHIFRKDLRRGWPLLVLWFAILAFWIEPIWRDPLYTEKLENIDGLRTTLITLAGMVAAALTIQHDPLVGVRAFWMTRPIRARSLLMAKAVFILMFFVLPPILLQFAALLRYGLPRERWVVQLLELSLPWAGLLAIACLLAAWTRGLPGFFALLVGLFVAPSFGFSFVRLFRASHFSISLATSLLPMLGLIALGLLAFQYATRRRFLGAAIGAALLPLGVLGLFRFDPYAYLHRVSTPHLPDMHVELTPGPGRNTFAAERPGETAGRVLDLWFVASPIPAQPGRALEISRVDGEIEWDDGRATPFYATGEWYLAESPARSSGLEWADGFGPQSSWRALGVQGDVPLESLLGRSGTLRGRAYGSVWKLGEVKTLPLTPGAEHGHGGSSVRIGEVNRPPGDLEIRLRSRELVDLRWSYPRMQLALANRARGETIPLLFRGEASQMLWGGLLSSPPFLLRAREGVWSPRAAGGLEEKSVDAEWLADAELLLTYYDFAGAADILVEAPNLTVDSVESGSPSLFTFSRAPWY
jgi:hypothetical protein